MGTLALPPFHLWPLLAIAFPVFFWCALTAPGPRRAFYDGWWFGFGFFVSGLYWFAYALLVDAARFGWMIPFAVFGLSAIIALYSGLAGLGFHAARRLKPLTWPFLGASVWVITEWVRGYLFTGFPWNSIGYVFTASDASLQAAAWLGIHGLSYLTVALSLLPVLYLAPKGGCHQAERHGAALWLGIAMLALIVSLGAMRLRHPTEYIEGTGFRLVQAGVQQYQKWDPNERLKAVQAHAKLTKSPGYENARFVVWSETSMTFPFAGHDEWSNELASLVPKDGMLFTGVVRIKTAPASSRTPIEVFNSLQSVDEKGNVSYAYDKRKLVPFGEFVPFRDYLPIEKITHGSLDFSTGKGPLRIPLPDNKGSLFPMICYEAIFPELAEGAWPGAILNITNDTWFGNSTGPYQHLAMSRMRAVEQGVPLLRDANSGVSAIIDAYGRVVKSLPLNTVGVLDSNLPKHLERKTFYSTYGNQLLVITLLLSFLICMRGFSDEERYI